MSVRIAVSDPLPAYRRGMIAILRDAGFEPEAPEDLMTWIKQDERRVVFLTLAAPHDWAVLADLQKASSDLIVVAVLAEDTIQSYVRAILAGALVAIPRDAPADTIRRIFEEALKGASMLPMDVIRTLAASSKGSIEEPPLSEQEIEWLRMLVRGVSVARLADANGYSERAMFRLLRAVYRRMGTMNRTEALLLASHHGWL
jgi:DNA-binding NarL/FixJ family response regulator